MSEEAAEAGSHDREAVDVREVLGPILDAADAAVTEVVTPEGESDGCQRTGGDRIRGTRSNAAADGRHPGRGATAGDGGGRGR